MFQEKSDYFILVKLLSLKYRDRSENDFISKTNTQKYDIPVVITAQKKMYNFRNVNNIRVLNRTQTCRVVDLFLIIIQFARREIHTRDASHNISLPVYLDENGPNHL